MNMGIFQYEGNHDVNNLPGHIAHRDVTFFYGVSNFVYG